MSKMRQTMRTKMDAFEDAPERFREELYQSPPEYNDRLTDTFARWQSRASA